MDTTCLFTQHDYARRTYLSRIYLQQPMSADKCRYPLLDEEHFTSTYVHGVLVPEVSESIVEDLLRGLITERANILVIVDQQERAIGDTASRTSKVSLALHGNLEGSLRNIQSIAALIGASRLRHRVQDIFLSARGDDLRVPLYQLHLLIALCDSTLRETHSIRISISGNERYRQYTLIQ